MKTFMEIKVTVHGAEHAARLYKGRPLRDCPTTYRYVNEFKHSIGNAYNGSYLTLYRVQGGFRYEIYRDGSFFPYYGRLEFLEKVDLR